MKAIEMGGRQDHVHRSQEAHHRKMTFQEEFIALLKRHRVEYDPRYLWE